MTHVEAWNETWKHEAWKHGHEAYKAMKHVTYEAYGSNQQHEAYGTMEHEAWTWKL
jgi:hypothetical protein